MKTVKTLLDSVREKLGTDAAVARRLEVPRSHVAEFRSGRRPISPETVAALCDVLELPGEEARQWVAWAMIENPKNSSRAAMLKRALFASWVLGVGALMTVQNDAKAALIVATSQQAVGGDSESRYTFVTNYSHIVARAVRWVRHWMARAPWNSLPAVEAT